MTVFRLTNDGTAPLTNAEDWFISNEYSSSVINTISDPDGGKGNEPTSIPSPFARIDLVRMAFKYVNDGAKPDTTFYKIVSDSIDIAEIFFNYEKHKGRIKIHEWDRVNDLNLLKSLNSCKEHQILEKSLSLYLAQDATAFNFDRMTKIFLLEYDSKIIGGTSPLTLFFPSANDLSNVDITFPNGDKAFDANPCPLYKRDPEFQKMLYALRASFTMFSSVFREVDEYLTKCLPLLQVENSELFYEIQKIINKEITPYNTQNYGLLAGGITIISNLPFYASKNKINPSTSDFIIKSEKYSGENKPLVLKKGHRGMHSNGTPMIYVTAPYDPNFDIPNFDKELILEKRILPGITGAYFPYLTISDFLEPYIIKTLFPINGNFFQNGNFVTASNEKARGYLLPIKKRYFDFFEINDLQNYTNTGKPYFEMIEGSLGQVTVFLRIPLANNEHIEYERVYKPSTSNTRLVEPDESKNTGSIIELDFSLSIYPILRINAPQMNHYRVGLFECDDNHFTKNAKYSLSFYNANGGECEDIPFKQRNEKADRLVNSYHYVIEKKVFDFIELDTGLGAKAIIIPKFKQVNPGVHPSVFAIDFGTTNTHIEYMFPNGNNNDSKPFDITTNDTQIAFLHDEINKNSLDTNSRIGFALNHLRPHFIYETLPSYLGKEKIYGFPTRTAISCHSTLNLAGVTHTLADLNIAFYFQKEPYVVGSSNKIHSELKWGATIDGNEKFIKHFFENLLFLIRNKVLLNDGDLSKVQLVCSYPTSMLSWRRELMANLWKDLYNKYFTTAKSPKFISESIAPFYFLKKRGGITAIDRPALSIDIGGETTDFVVFVKNIPKVVSSARFAANAIFGDGFNQTPQTNGFVQYYRQRINTHLDKGGFNELKNVMQESQDSSNSFTIINSYFALESNKAYNPTGTISFNKMLSSEPLFKILFVLYYVAIIYHIGKLMKTLGISAPSYLTFSGMGSKIINIIGDDAVKKVTKIVFKQIFEDIEIEVQPIPTEPKEITAKGGVYFGLNDNSEDDFNNVKYVLLGDKDLTIVNSHGHQKTYNDLDEALYNSVAEEYNNFIHFFEKIGNEINFNDVFGFTKNDFMSYKDKIASKSKVKEFIKLGVEQKSKQLNKDLNQPIEETLFFYPLIGGLNMLAYEIYKKQQKQSSSI